MVLILVPNSLHKDIVLAAAAAGKHVCCEKPLAMDAAEAKEMYDAVEKAGVKHQTAFNLALLSGRPDGQEDDRRGNARAHL